MSKRLFWLVNGANKERRVVAGLDGEEERTVEGQVDLFCFIEQQRHLANINLGVGGSFAAVFVDFHMAFLLHVGNGDVFFGNAA